MRYVRAPATHFAQMRDATGVVLDLERRNYLHLNASGAVLWEALADGVTIDELAEALASSFSIDRQQARRDALAWVEDMLTRGALIADG